MDDLLYKPVKTPDDVNKLMNKHKNLVYKLLADFGYLGMHEYESAGLEALWTAIETFDIFANNAFSTYAYKCIKNALNSVYRLDMTRRKHYISMDFTENEMEFVVDDATIKIESDEAVQKILTYTREYLDNLDKNTFGYKAIQLWYSTQFTLTPSKIAEMIGTSTSIVSRAQQLFRAYISRRLREERRKEHA